MDILTIVVALVLIFIAWKVVTGVIKYGLIAVISIAAIWFVTNGGFA